MTSSAQNLDVKPPKEMSPKVHNVQFYRRPLPPSCIAFTSEEGKQIFAEALAAGHMNCFFKVCRLHLFSYDLFFLILSYSLFSFVRILSISSGAKFEVGIGDLDFSLCHVIFAHRKLMDKHKMNHIKTLV